MRNGNNMKTWFRNGLRTMTCRLVKYVMSVARKSALAILMIMLVQPVWASEIIDQIGGWSSGKVGEGYGEGCSVLKFAKWMTRLQLNQNQGRTL